MTQPGRPNDPEATKALATLLAALVPKAASATEAVASPDFARAIEALSRSSGATTATAQQPAVETPGASWNPVAGPSSHRTRERTTSGNAPQTWHAQPTRSGRVPRLPDPSSISADPLSLLDLPSESESDDPDFRPHGLSPRQAKRASRRASATGGESGESPPWGGIGTDTDADWGAGGQDDLFGLGSFIGAPTDVNALSHAALLNSLDFSTALSQSQHPTGGPTFGESPEWTGISSTPAATTGEQGASNPDGRPSPLTAASLAGIPFVNVNLPESDDSPEFLPPPSKRQRRERDRESHRAGSVAGSEISLRSRGAAKEQIERPPSLAQSRPVVHQTAQDAAISRNNPALSSHDLIANYKSQTVNASVVAPHAPPVTFARPDHQSAPSASASQSTTAAQYLTKAGTVRMKTGPKPKLDKEEKAERKRQLMRDTRARNKEYVEDLEARVVELEEEWVAKLQCPRFRVADPSCS